MAEQYIIEMGKNYNEDEIYASFYTCPNCGENEILGYANYCPMCGIKIMWQGQVPGCERESCDEYEGPMNPYNPKSKIVKFKKCEGKCTLRK